MKRRIWTSFWGLALLAPTMAVAQSPAIARMKAHIEYLASDSLEGREAGTPGEWIAADYISMQMEKGGAAPAGTVQQWLQEFDFFNSRMPMQESFVKVGGKSYTLGTEFMPLPESGVADFHTEIVFVGYGIQAPAKNHDDYKGKKVEGKVVLIERGHPEPDNPHSEFGELAPLAVKLDLAAKMGATAVLFVDPEGQAMDVLEFNYTRKTAQAAIPGVYLPGAKANTLAGKTVEGYILLEDDYRVGKNVLAKVDNGAANTIVIGAHYDHLGYGEEGSLHRGERAIHNGADDNASGTAMLIELASVLDAAPYNRYNYLLIAFSGEEKGLLGSNYFAKNPTLDLGKVACMINFDMVGRLDPEKNTLAINGTGTSPVWGEVLPTITIDDMKVKTGESGVGPSDHTSFYLKDIPVLHFFSGTHPDYHKPSDDSPLINYDGMDKIHRYVLALLEKLNQRGGDKLAFTATKQEDNTEVPRWKVTLGVVPDYMFDGEGMRIDGVTEGKPAFKAGLEAGDIVVDMGGMPVKDMMSYMRALSKFEKGQEVTVTVLRDGKKKKKKVQF